MTWDAEHWADWAIKCKGFASARGAILEAIILSEERQAEFFHAALNDKEGRLDVNAGKGHEKLMGIKVLFTPKIPPERAIHVFATDIEAHD